MKVSPTLFASLILVLTGHAAFSTEGGRSDVVGDQTLPDGDTILYYSPDGQAYAKSHHIPDAPFHRRTMQEVNPNRNVTAAHWNAPFCYEWTDLCTDCVRQPNNVVACHLREPPVTKPCLARPVMCTSTGGPSRFFGLDDCKELEGTGYFQNANGQVRANSWTQSGLWWFFARHDHKWHYYLADGSDYPSLARYKGAPYDQPHPHPVWYADDNVCRAVYGDPKDEQSPVIEIEK